MALLHMLLAAAITIQSAAKDPETTPLNEWPMVMCHDAATTYLKTGPVNKWYKTQMDGGVRQELVCGARSFDWRPAVVGDTVYMHHAGNVITVPMAQVAEAAELSEPALCRLRRAACSDVQLPRFHSRAPANCLHLR
eukprot:SAG11_NODE_123_length_15805_cov_15.133261_7_plen_137_part_00